MTLATIDPTLLLPSDRATMPVDPFGDGPMIEDDFPADAYEGISHEMTEEEFLAFDEWVSEQELAAGMTAEEQRLADEFWARM